MAIDITKPATFNNLKLNDLIADAVERKDEAALLIYNLAPYALLSRRETAMMAKRLFPNFFGTVETINASFTKLYASNGKLIDTPRTISIEVMPDHTTYTIERVFLELGSMLNVNKS